MQAVDTDFRTIGNVAVIVSVGVIEVGETIRSSHPEVFLGKGVLKICSKFTGEYPCRSVISINFATLLITLQHGCSPVNFLHIFRTPFLKNTSGWLLLNYDWQRY